MFTPVKWLHCYNLLQAFLHFSFHQQWIFHCQPAGRWYNSKITFWCLFSWNVPSTKCLRTSSLENRLWDEDLGGALRISISVRNRGSKMHKGQSRAMMNGNKGLSRLCRDLWAGDVHSDGPDTDGSANSAGNLWAGDVPSDGPDTDCSALAGHGTRQPSEQRSDLGWDVSLMQRNSWSRTELRGLGCQHLQNLRKWVAYYWREDLRCPHSSQYLWIPITIMLDFFIMSHMSLILFFVFIFHPFPFVNKSGLFYWHFQVTNVFYSVQSITQLI